jgi:predicted RNase H-like nuclease (RuvC/YqgF family)
MDRENEEVMGRYEDRIKQLELEVKEKQEEVEITNNQSTIDILEEDIYNTKQSIEELKKYV